MTKASTTEELREIVEKQAGYEAMQKMLDKHIDNLMALREQLAIDDIELLSTNIEKCKHVDRTAREKIASLNVKMHDLIQKIAASVGNVKYTTLMQDISGLGLSQVQKEKAAQLVSADKKVHISFQSLKLVIDIFYEINKLISIRLNDSQTIEPGINRNTTLGNALLVCEITDFTIQFIETYRMQGIDALHSIHRDKQNEINRWRSDDKVLLKTTKSSTIEDCVRQDIITDISNREKNIKLLEQEWDAYMSRLKNLQGESDSVSKKAPSLRAIRDNAKAQINMLQAVVVSQIVQNNVRVIEGVVMQWEKIKLSSLSVDGLQRLLRMAP